MKQVLCREEHRRSNGIISAPKHVFVLGTSDHSARRIEHDEPDFHPYKLAIVQVLSECNFNARRNACGEQFLNTSIKTRWGFSVMRSISTWSDASISKICASGLTALKNSTRGLCIHHASPFGAQSCQLVLIAYGFFEENQSFHNLFEKIFSPQLDEIDLEDAWLQQEGATVHSSRTLMAMLQKHFPVCQRGDLEWRLRSPDLILYDFFLWGY